MSANQLHQASLIEGKAKKPLDIFGFVSRYGIIIVAAGLAILTMLIPLVLMISKPNYETSAMLKIDPVIPSLITNFEEPSITGYYHDYVRTQARRITEFTVLKKAIEQLSPVEKAAVLPAHLSADECVPILQAIMHINPVPSTHLVELSIHGPEKEGLATMLNSVMEVYLQKMRDELVDANKHRLSYLTAKKVELAENIKKKEMEIQQLATSALTSTFAEDFNLWQQRTSELQKSYVHMYGERIQAENAYKYQETSSAQLGELSLDSLVNEGVMNNQAIGFTSSWTYQQLQDMRASIDGVTKDNEDRKRVEIRMQAMREYESTLREETRKTIDSITYGNQKLQLARELIKKENSFHEALENEEMLKAAFAEAKIKSGENSATLLQGQSMEIELKNERDMYFRIGTRIEEMEAESRASLRVSIEAQAREPENPAGTNIKKLLMLCVIVSFGSVGGLFALIEFFDNRIHSPKDIIHAFGHPPSWPISRSSEDIPFLDVISKGGSTVTAKAIRSLATRLFREFEKNQSRVFLFTAVDTGCGNTEILLNTAQALACHVQKVLVVDGNLTHGDLSEKLKLPHSQPGLLDMLEERNSFDECVYHDTRRSIDILCSRANTPDRATLQHLQEFLKRARKDYDAICIDSCPVRSSDFTEYLTVQSDVVVLISQGESTLYRDLRQTADILIRLDIPALATVLNWGGEKKKIWLDAYLDRTPNQVKRLFTRDSKQGSTKDVS